MKTYCRLSAVLVALLFGIAAAKAELGKPMAVVSIASYDEQMANIDFLGGLTGQPNASAQLNGMLMMFTQGQGLKGLDKTKPWGFAVMAEGEGEGPQMMVFVPVSSAKDLVDTLAIYLGPAQDEGGGILKISPPRSGQEVYVREHNGWAFVTQQKYAGALPDDPLKLLAGLNPDYDVAARGFLQNIPASKKQEWLDQLKMMADRMAQGRDEVSAELQSEAQRLQLQMLERCLNDTDQVTLGWKLNKDAKNTHVDFGFTAVPGSKLAAGLKGFENPQTNFAGFLNPEYAFQFLTAHTHSPEHIEHMLAMFGIYRKAALETVDKDEDLANDEDRKSVKTAVNQLFDVIDATIKTGKSDMGVSVNLAPQKLQAAAGGFVADGKALESAVKNLVELAKGEEEFAQNVTVTFDVETYKDIRFHHAKVNLPDEDAQQVFGEQLDVYLGVGDKAAYLAAGKDSLAYIKSIIDSSAAQANKQVQPMQLTVSLVSILEFAASVKPDGPAAMVAGQLAELKGKDRILVNLKPVSNGLMGRVEVEGGVLEAFKTMAAAKMQGGGPPQGFGQ